jgi:drug/metabolite transporter (DMT)-like permease
MSLDTDHKGKAATLLLFAIMLGSMQDAIVKSLSGSYPIYEFVIFRGLASLPILGGWLIYAGGARQLITPYLPMVLLRAVIICSAYFSFILSLAALPMADAVSYYFTMPFFVAGLAGPFLGERVRLHRWLAITAGFLAVVWMVQPGRSGFEPAAILSLYSAFGYAVSQMMSRYVADKVPPVVIANWQNVIYFSAGLALAVFVLAFGPFSSANKSLAFLLRDWLWPKPFDLFLMLTMGALAAVAMGFFINAYKLAEASFVAAFEYSGMVWAALFGFLFFQDVPGFRTITGSAIVVAAGLIMAWFDRRLAGRRPATVVGITPADSHPSP